MQLYPFNSAVILNDSIFTLYGGQTGSFGQAQRNAAYLASEMMATKYIGTPLLPVIVTGTYLFQGSRRVITDFGYVSQLLSVTVYNQQEVSTCKLTPNDGCGYIADDTFGYIDVKQLQNTLSFFIPSFVNIPYPAPYNWNFLVPYQFQIAYQCGLPTGTSNLPTALQALTIVAQDFLNEMSYPSLNEGVGNIGIQRFSNMDYSEQRLTLKRTAFGQSARSNLAAQLWDSTIKKARRSLMLRNQ